MSETQTVPPIINRAMKYVLRSPLHRIISKNILLLTFTGRKSGKRYTTPVSYSQAGDEVTIFTHAAWWNNMRDESPVTLRVRGHDLQGMATAVAADKQAVADGLAAHLLKVPFDARFYGVTFDDDGNPNAAEVAHAVQSVVMIRVRLC